VRLPRGTAASALLGIPALAFGVAVRLRNRWYDRPGAVRRAPLPVISVGNLTVGGTGKTPLVACLARWLLAEGSRPAIVSRGYGGRAGRGPLVVSIGSGPLCPPEACGDEPFLLARALDGVAVVVGSDRWAAARCAATRGANVVLLDDGFQHRRLARELDVVLLDAAAPLGSGRLLPAGPLREPPSALARADVVIATRTPRGATLEALEQLVRRHNPRAPLLGADHRIVGFVDVDGRPVVAPRSAVAFCGIGNPQRFRDDLLQHGIELLAFRAYPDHHPYAERELAELAELAERDGAFLVTTEKDLARRTLRPRGPTRLVACRIEARLHDPERLHALVRQALGRAAA
jgi:tetraacyldisaccharide 4'-kinase